MCSGNYRTHFSSSVYHCGYRDWCFKSDTELYESGSH